MNVKEVLLEISRQTQDQKFIDDSHKAMLAADHKIRGFLPDRSTVEWILGELFTLIHKEITKHPDKPVYSVATGGVEIIVIPYSSGTRVSVHYTPVSQHHTVSH